MKIIGLVEKKGTRVVKKEEEKTTKKETKK